MVNEKTKEKKGLWASRDGKLWEDKYMRDTDRRLGLFSKVYAESSPGSSEESSVCGTGVEMITPLQKEMYEMYALLLGRMGEGRRSSCVCCCSVSFSLK